MKTYLEKSAKNNIDGVLEVSTAMANKVKNNIILVTGGSGYLGTHLVQKLIEKYADMKVRIVARSENEIQRVMWICNNRLEPVIGDIRDTNVLRFALRNVDTLIHLAAMKHIDFCDTNPLEATTINVIGTISLLEYFEGQTFIGMSTDKALEPRGCYGATKLLMEKLILERAKRSKNRRYMIIRSGNIFASSGSVIEKWRRDIETSNEIVVTDLGMTRFFVSADTLSEFIVEVMEKGLTGRVYIPLQKAIVLKDLATAVMAFWGNKDTKVRVAGVRKGEKQHEKLFLSDEKVVTELENDSSRNVGKMDIEEITNLIRASMKRNY